MRYDFMILDVFTDKAFGGNQLAVITDARRITVDAMQTIAREFDYPETTFVLPPTDPSNARRVRIFTPGGELPFAGHPTIGTACALVMAGQSEVGEVVLEEGVGPVLVTTKNDRGVYSARLQLSRGPDVSDLAPTIEDAAAIASLDVGDIRQVFCAGMGPKFTFVHVNSRETVDRCQLDHQQWRRLLSDTWGPHLFVFAGEFRNGAEIYGRMFAPALGIPEDPATGAAAAAIVGAASAAQGHQQGEFSLDIVQGVAMGRASFLKASARFDNGTLVSTDVGGSCVLVAEGEIEVPEDLLEAEEGQQIVRQRETL
jgi:trans-2,3-dihydro-3-hydroxyanthranilate isomerase